MKKWRICAGLLYGAYWYASRRWDFKDTLVLTHKNPSKSWSAPANYWIGMVYYQRADYEMADQAFAQLLVDHSTSTYVPKTLLRRSEVAISRRDWPTARESLERFLNDYPDDKQRNIAEQRLEVVKFK